MAETKYPVLDRFAPSRVKDSRRTREDARFLLQFLNEADNAEGQDVPDWLRSLARDFYHESHCELKYDDGE